VAWFCRCLPPNLSRLIAEEENHVSQITQITIWLGVLGSFARRIVCDALMPFPFDPSPSTLWTLHREGKVASCELRFVPLGNEVRMLRNGSVLMSRIFESG
jgi:hypothetical protein